MKLISIQVGMPKTVNYKGKDISTGIFKNPIKGPVMVRKLNLDGDGQADLRVHGGVDKAVYGYSLDAYSWWQKNRPQDKYVNGAFGENLSIDKILEDQTFIGDTFEIGGAVLQVAQPRLPCFKLAVKFNDPGILKTFLTSQRPGVYFRVLKEGMIDEGQEFKLVNREKTLLSILELANIMGGDSVEEERAAEFSKLMSLPEKIRLRFE